MDSLPGNFPLAVPTLYGNRLDVPGRLLSRGLPGAASRPRGRPFSDFADPLATLCFDTLGSVSGPLRPAEHVLPHRSLDPESWVFLLRSPVRASQIQFGSTPAARSIHHLSSVALHTDGLSQGLAGQAVAIQKFKHANSSKVSCGSLLTCDQAQTTARHQTIPAVVPRSSRCQIHFDQPTIAITRAYQRARNNWDFDPQCIERSSDAGGMDSLDTCNPSFQLNHVRGFQLRSIAHISDSGADLQRQCELGDVDVTIDVTLTLVKVTGKVIVLLHLNGSSARLTNCTSEHILMFLVICAVLQAKLEHGFAHFCFAQFDGREAISPNPPILKEECSI